MRVGLLSNLQAGKNEDQVQSLLDSCSGLPDLIHVETNCAGDVPGALWDFANWDVDVLAVNGGDGTLQTVLTEILGHDAFDGRVPMIAPLRGGTTNMTALDIGTQRNSALAMADLAFAARSGGLEELIEERHVLRVQYGVHRHVEYGMFFGGGTIHRAIHFVKNVLPRGKAQGVLGATAVTAGLLGRLAVGQDAGGILDPDKAHVILDHELLADDQFSLMLASSLDRLFARMRPFWGEGEGGVRFTSIAKGAARFGTALPGILAGRPAEFVCEDAGYVSRNVRKASLRLDSGFTIDGEQVDVNPGGEIHISADDVVRFVRV